MTADWPWALFLLLISPAIGSHLGVLVDRLPQGLLGIFSPSRCAKCDARIAWHDLVPVLSALALRGRCRVCGKAIPSHLMRVEIAAMLAALLAVVLTRNTLDMWLTVGALWCLIALFYSDLLHFRLPDPLTFCLGLLGLALAASDPARGITHGFVSATIGAGAFWLIAKGYSLWRGREGLGFGDVKLMAGVGAAVGWPLIPAVTLIAALMALAVVAVEAVRRRSWPRADARLPFGSFLAGATVLVLLL